MRVSVVARLSLYVRLLLQQHTSNKASRTNYNSAISPAGVTGRYAKDYVECLWLILLNDKPDDFVIATDVQHTVREFATLAFHDVGIELEWQGEDANEKCNY